ncbi:MAG: AIPR family protein [Parachlamydiaceae bacterium]
MDQKEFYQEFMQDLYARSGADSNFLEPVFTERMCDFLVDQAIVQNYTIAEFKKTSMGVRVDAWNYNEETDVLSLFVADFRPEREITSLTQTDVDKAFKRLEKFFDKCRDSDFIDSLEESTQGYAIAREIYERQKDISRVHFYLLSNAALSSRVTSMKSDDKSRLYQVWDIVRLANIEGEGKSREDMVVEFEGGIPCLPAFTGSQGWKSYLLVMPGSMIASLYGQYGERLLEQNVRTFLQFRGKVNKGIRNTIQNQPGMFFAYNNGLTTTAEAVDVDKDLNVIRSVTNLQIVNGGQTTSSLFAAERKKYELKDVYVQVKLSVIPSEDVDTVVPIISKCANTQNTVNAADFFSNHAFHLRIEEFSRRLWAPAVDGAVQDTHWFYERARGQFANAYANLIPTRQKGFLLKNPKLQMFTKTDVAKFQYSFDQMPHVVSKGAQDCFAQFASTIGWQWEQDEKRFNELYFKHLIAKAIVFRSLDSLIMRQDWYGGYKANIVTYTISLLSHLVSKARLDFNLLKIWEAQKISSLFKDQLLEIASKVNEAIQDTDANVTQYCKQIACWQAVQNINISLSDGFLSELAGRDQVREQKKSAVKEQAVLNEIQAQTYVFKKGAAFWKKLLQWNKAIRILSPKEIGIVEYATNIPNKIPSEMQSKILIQVEEKAKEDGFVA